MCEWVWGSGHPGSQGDLHCLRAVGQACWEGSSSSSRAVGMCDWVWRAVHSAGQEAEGLHRLRAVTYVWTYR